VYGEAVVKGYRKVVRFIRAAGDERDFRAMRSLNFENLKGNRCHQHSFRLNDQWRLIVEIKEGNPKNVIEVVDIEDYH
jgi:toxin HigB-1